MNLEKYKKILADPRIAKYQLVFLSLGSVGICTLLIGFLIIPQFLKLNASKQEIETINAETESLNNKISTLNSVNISEYKDSLNTTLVALPEDKDITGIIGQLLAVIAASGLTVDALSLGGTVQDSGVPNYQANISVSGDRSALKVFFDNIKSAPRIMKVSNLDINNSGSLSRATATIDILAYYQPLPTEIGNINQPITLLTDKDKQLIAKIKSSFQSSASAPTSTDSGTLSPVGKSDPFN